MFLCIDDANKKLKEESLVIKKCYLSGGKCDICNKFCPIVLDVDVPNKSLHLTAKKHGKWAWREVNYDGNQKRLKGDKVVDIGC